MDIAELIERAKKAAGSQLAVGEKIGRPHSRISEWKAGRRKPDAADIMLLAEVAGLPPLETLAEIESQLDAERSSVWQRALSSLRTAGAGTVLAILVLVGLCGPPDHAQAAVRYSDSALPSHGRGHWFDPSTAHQRIQGPASHDAGPFRFGARHTLPAHLDRRHTADTNPLLRTRPAGSLQLPAPSCDLQDINAGPANSLKPCDFPTIARYRQSKSSLRTTLRKCCLTTDAEQFAKQAPQDRRHPPSGIRTMLRYFIQPITLLSARKNENCQRNFW